MSPARQTSEGFWAKVTKGDGCWEWGGSRFHFGHGKATDPERPRHQTAASRVAWRLTYGPIPEGMNVLHRCDGSGSISGSGSIWPHAQPPHVLAHEPGGAR